MDARHSYITESRRVRERVYAKRIKWATLASVLFHALLLLVFAPLKQQMPLVRNVGYEGALRILPEISVQRPPGEVDTEAETALGRGSEPFFRVIETRLANDSAPAAEEPKDDTGEFDEEFGEDLLHFLEQALPQPTSRDVVVLRIVKPGYPQSSIEKGVEGVVLFRIHVTKRGRVSRAWLMGSEVDPACEEAARRAIMQWRFRPHVINGVPTDFLVDQRIRFRLYGGEGAVPRSGR